MSCAARVRLLSLSLLFAGTAALVAQGGRGGRGMGPSAMPGGVGVGGSPGMPHRGLGQPAGGGVTPGFPHGSTVPAVTGSPGGGTRGGLQLGPPGRWWDDKKFAKSLGLNGDQQKRMDSVFSQNRDGLLQRYDALQKAESRLETLTRFGKPSETALFMEIDRVSQARAELEKATTHLQLQLRDEMTLDQLGKLDDHH